MTAARWHYSTFLKIFNAIIFSSPLVLITSIPPKLVDWISVLPLTTMPGSGSRAVPARSADWDGQLRSGARKEGPGCKYLLTKMRTSFLWAFVFVFLKFQKAPHEIL